MDLPVMELLLLLVMWMTGQGSAVRYFTLQASSVDDLLNRCIDGRNHKIQPGPEATLFQHCFPWRNRSCCTQESAQGLHFHSSWLNFNWHHCQILSPKCAQHFIKDLCFYECSPNLGPWIEPDVRKIRKERTVGVPLCQSECSSWWEDCKHDFTCLDNWATGFNWSTGINTCPVGKPCKKFEEIFHEAQTFCEGIWNKSFKVVPDGEDCFRLWFSPNRPNPNDAVARRYAEKLFFQTDGGSSAGADIICDIFIRLSILVLSFVLAILQSGI